MPYISYTSRRRILLFLSVFLLTVFLNMMDFQPLRNLSSVLYGSLLIVWSMTVQQRILQGNVRRLMIAGTMFLLALFVLRICRWVYFAWLPAVDRFLWAAYYVPFTGVPLISLCAALCVGRDDRERPLQYAGWLFMFWGLLCAGVLTNGIHHALFLPVEWPWSAVARYGWLYAAVVVWCLSFTLASYGVLIHRCRLSECRKLWYVPVLALLLCAALLIWYFVAGGSPTMVGMKLYHLQEAFAFSFVFLWESCIQIGLVPSNSDYDALFRLSHLSAALEDQEGNIVYRAEAFLPANGETLVQLEHPVSGGRILWAEDRSAIYELNDALQDATEVLEEENELIEQENRIQAEKARYMEQNRLYDKITDTVRPQLAAIAEFLDTPPQDKAAFRQAMAHSMVLGAYVKRRANLELLADRQSHISLEELAYAIRESFEYLTLSGCTCELQAKTSAEVPAALLSMAYDLFELVVEAAYPVCTSYSAVIAWPFSLALAVDSERLPLDPDWRRAARTRVRVSLSVFSEDDTTYVRLIGAEAQP